MVKLKASLLCMYTHIACKLMCVEIQIDIIICI